MTQTEMKFQAPSQQMIDLVMDHVRTDLEKQARGKGGTCPCCNQFVKVYRRTINSMMANQLCHAAKNYDITDEFHVGELPQCASGVGDWAKLQYWGLIREVDADNDGSKRKAGVWRITEKGVMFAERKAYVPKYAIVYNGRLLELEGENIDIVQALGQKFNYAQIMQPYSVT